MSGAAKRKTFVRNVSLPTKRTVDLTACFIRRLLDNDAQTPALFALDNSTGVITTLAPLDREQQITHHLTILAVDGGGKEERSSKCHVTVHVIDVNDSPPGFSESHYTLSISEE